MRLKHGLALTLTAAWVLSIGTRNINAATLTISSGACAFGDCLAGGSSVARQVVITDVPEFSGSMSAAGTINYGVFHGAASVDVNGPPDSGTNGDGFGAEVQGIDTELWTITGGTGTGQLALAWTITGASSPEVAVGGVTDAFLTILATANGGALSTGDVTTSGVYPGQGGIGGFLSFQFGVPFTIRFTDTVQADYSVTDDSQGTIGSAAADFSNTAILTGVTITDAFGNPVPGALITSDAGVQFPLPSSDGGSTSTPEPGSLALVMAALVAVGVARRVTAYLRR
jgi:PEP-CTERM motif